MMNRHQIYLPIVLFLITFAQNVFSSTVPKISENIATKQMQEHIGKTYLPLNIGKLEFSSNHITQNRLTEIARSREKYQNAGLIKFNQSRKKISPMQQAMGGKDIVMIVSLTEKGKEDSIRCISNKGVGELRGFHVGKRLVDKIVSIGDDNTVLFAYTFTPNENGLSVGEKKAKYRGKAVFSYDPFLEEYKFNGFWYSEWEKEEWGDAAWIYNKDGETVCTW